MRGKILLIIILIVILAGVGYFIYSSSGNKADAKNCTYVIEGKDITLENGYSEEEIVPGAASKLVTRYFGNEASGDFDGDGFSDTAFVLTQDSGGSGTFYYLAAALGGDQGCRGTNAVFLGDRIAPQSTEFRDGKIIVNYADRRPDEPMSAQPSVGVSKYFKIEGGKLSEVEEGKLIDAVTYLCDGGRTMTAAYYEGPEPPETEPGEPPVPTGSVEVSLDGAASSTLRQTISASGIRYANEDETFVFWSKGNEAFIMRDGEVDSEYANCSGE